MNQKVWQVQGIGLQKANIRFQHGKIKTRLSVNFNPAFASNIAVMIVPVIEGERTEYSANAPGITPRNTRKIVSDLSTNAIMIKETSGYLHMKFNRSVLSLSISLD